MVGTRRRSRTARLAQAQLALVFLSPTLALVVIFQYYPALSALYHAFTVWDGVSPATYAGLSQFGAVFADPEFGAAALNILKLTGFWMLLAVSVPLVVARLILSIPSPRRQFAFRLLFILPFVVPQVVTILVWQFIYAGDGALNQLLGAFHLSSLAQDWLGGSNTALYAIMFMGFPYVDGFGLMVYTAGLQAIPAEITEAAALDGAGALNAFFRIEVPQILGQIRLMWVLAAINGIQNFTQILILTNGGPGYATSVPGLMMFHEAFSYQQMGKACAIGTDLFVVILALTIINMRLLRPQAEHAASRAKRRRARLAGRSG